MQAMDCLMVQHLQEQFNSMKMLRYNPWAGIMILN